MSKEIQDKAEKERLRINEIRDLGPVKEVQKEYQPKEEKEKKTKEPTKESLSDYFMDIDINKFRSTFTVEL